MALLTGGTQIFAGDTTVVDSIQQFPLGTKAFDVDGNEYIYMKGIASTAVGSWVTYDELYVTALLAADAKGAVAVAMAAITAATKWGWYCICGTVHALISVNSAVDSPIGFETTAGYAGDGRAAGDMIYGALQREAITSVAGLADVQIYHPFVTDGATV